jgi:hypothetical protein
VEHTTYQHLPKPRPEASISSVNRVVIRLRRITKNKQCDTCIKHHAIESMFNIYLNVYYLVAPPSPRQTHRGKILRELNSRPWKVNRSIPCFFHLNACIALQPGLGKKRREKREKKERQIFRSIVSSSLCVLFNYTEYGLLLPFF